MLGGVTRPKEDDDDQKENVSPRRTRVNLSGTKEETVGLEEEEGRDSGNHPETEDEGLPELVEPCSDGLVDHDDSSKPAGMNLHGRAGRWALSLLPRRWT
jgi:hypothetical protein